MIFLELDSLPIIFRIFRIVIPTFGGIIICLVLCRCFYECRKRREDRRQLAQASAHTLEPPPSVYIIPGSQAQEQRHRPPQPQYNLPQQYPPPPAYNELMPKPDFPSAPPPAYTEVIGSRINPPPQVRSLHPALRCLSNPRVRSEEP